MFIRQYFNNWITNVLAITFLTLALLSFGYAEYFDRLFITYLICIFIFQIRNANTVSIVLIILCERFLEEIIFLTSSNVVSKPLIYLLSLFLVKKLWYDFLSKRLILPTITICILCEIYWYATSYSPPKIHSYIAMLILNMITRHFIFLRIPSFKKIISTNQFQKHITIQLKAIPLDLQLYTISMLSCVVVFTIIAEYLLRHVFHINSLVVYEYYSYFMHALTVSILFFITNYTVKSVYKIIA
jgi:hypothetical protein